MVCSQPADRELTIMVHLQQVRGGQQVVKAFLVQDRLGLRYVACLVHVCACIHRDVSLTLFQFP